MSLSVSQFLSCSAIARVTRNPKNQIPNPKSASRTDSSFGEQTPKRQFSKLVAGCLSSFGRLRFVWSSELGAWDLGFTNSLNSFPQLSTLQTSLEILDRLRDPFLELHLRFPTEHFLRARDGPVVAPSDRPPEADCIRSALSSRSE